MPELDLPGAVFLDIDVVGDDLDVFCGLLAEEVGEDGADGRGHAARRNLSGVFMWGSTAANLETMMTGTPCSLHHE